VCSMIFMLARMCIRIGRFKLENSYIMFNLRKESALSKKFMCWNNTFTKGARFIEEFLCVCPERQPLHRGNETLPGRICAAIHCTI
jgi:hypothetical protein